MSDVLHAPITTADLIAEFVSLRDQKKVADEKYEEFAKLHFSNRMDELKLLILDHLNTTGLDSVSGAGFTAYKLVQTSATVGDARAFREWVIDQQAWEMLDWRVNKTATKEAVEDGQPLPPGINFSQAVTIGIRRK